MNTKKCEGLLGEMGYIEERCQKCRANLYESKIGTTSYICLNGCHLSSKSLEKFNKMVKEASEK